jgi:hypothetical protein
MDGAHKYFQDISYRSQRRDLGTGFYAATGAGRVESVSTVMSSS